MSTTIGHYFNHLTCTLFVILGLLGIFAPASQAATGAFTFSAATYAANEGAGNVYITINRVGGSTGAATVQWRTNSLTAKFTKDYGDFGLTTLNFAAGETQKVMPITIVNDTLIEPNETFKVTLSSPTLGTILGTVTSAVVTIQDNDSVAADTTAPTVALTSPATATTYTSAQTVTVTASASDNVGVTKVELYNGATLIATDTTAPYSYAWAITAANNGSHNFTAKAYDAAGNSKVSAAAAVTVNIPVPDLTAPTISLSSPSNASTFTTAQTVAITASASDNVGVSKVELYNGATLVATDTTAPYSYAWTITAANNGSHNFTAKAFDAAGNSKVSVAAAVTVSIPVAQPGTFTFAVASSAVSEGAGKVNVTINRVGGSAGIATIDWKTQGVSATFAQDYGNFDWTTLTFADGETSKIQSVTIVDDTLVEGNEAFNALLSNPTGGATLGTITTNAVTIQDNDTVATDTVLPTVALTSPANGTNYTTAQTVTITASASDNVSVSKVELYNGTTLVATDTTSPYSFAWAITSATNGSRSLSAKAYDAAGNSKVSTAVSVTVNISSTPVVTGPAKVFPGAEGFGTASVAGRGGQIIKVTNLNDSGIGSLREALNATGPRIVVFEVSGTIRLATDLKIQNPYITVAGQTAPSPGISLRGAGMIITTHDVLVQHLRIRVGDDLAGPSPINRDALQILGNSTGTSTYNVVIDHISACWAIDENLSTWYAQHDVTISNSIVSEGLNLSLHPKGAHSKGILVGDLSKNVALIGNLMAHNVSRNPMIKGGTSTVVVNNLSYNADDYDFFGIVDPEGRGPSIVSSLSNVFITGPDTKYGIPAMGGGIIGSKIYQSGNYYTDGKIVSTGLAPYLVSTPPISFSPLTVQAGSLVEAAVLEYAGARPADRDAVDQRIVNEVKTRSGGYVDSPSQVGGWPTLAMNTKAFIVPANPNGDDDGDGYTNVEEILHQMAAKVEGRIAL